MGTTITAMQEVDGAQKPVVIDLDEYIRRLVAEQMPIGVEPRQELHHSGHNTAYWIEGNRLYVVADIGPDAHKRATQSTSKANWTVANTKGHPFVEGSPIPKLRLAFTLYTGTAPEVEE